MSIPYRTRRNLRRAGIVFAVLFLIFFLCWACWIVWLQRYVVYTDNGVELDFSVSANEVFGEVPSPPVAEANVPIFFNEGANAINTTHDLEPLVGYYISNDMFKQDPAGVLLQVERLSAGTPVMIEMKGPYGSFFYNSGLANAVISASTDIPAMEKLVQRLKDKGFYTIAQISAFRDREFGDKNVPCGLYNLSRVGLWPDQGGMYWLDPTNANVTSWISSVVVELRDMGFNEVVLDNFCFPAGEQYIFNGDKAAALETAAKTIVNACSASNFVISFQVEQLPFPLPSERSRIYLKGVDAGTLEQKASQSELEDTQVNLVFLTDTADSRYENYSVLRSITIAQDMEVRNGN